MLKGKNYLFLKRIFDITMSVFLLILFFPIILVVSALIKLNSPGPILADVPERLGKNKRKFKMYKFRSMVVNAHYLLRTDPQFKRLYEEYKHGSYKLKNDPRVTRVGRFIRKHSLDEIPQLINVLKGDMSLVGPRAYYHDEYQEQLKKFSHCKRYFRKVFQVKPGITGLWQVSGRSDIDFERRIKLDAYYVSNLSFWLDLRIILKTPWVMISGQGAV